VCPAGPDSALSHLEQHARVGAALGTSGTLRSSEGGSSTPSVPFWGEGLSREAV
jgi:hypothetical protein